jgi:hypothetical protein
MFRFTMTICKQKKNPQNHNLVPQMSDSEESVGADIEAAAEAAISTLLPAKSRAVRPVVGFEEVGMHIRKSNVSLFHAKV